MEIITNIFFGVALPTLIGVGVNFASGDSPGAEFLVARLCFILAAVDAAGFAAYWLWPAIGQSVSWRLILAALSGAIILPTLIIALHWVDLREAVVSKNLIPANLANPPLPAGCVVPPNALMVFYGSNVAWSTKMPHTVLRMGTEKMIEIDRDKESNNLVVTTLRIFDDRNNIIARIDEDGFWVENSTRNKRPDQSTLVVYDHTDTEVLHITFLNPRALLLTGTFRYASFPTARITSDSMTLGHTMLREFCSGESNVDIQIGN